MQRRPLDLYRVNRARPHHGIQLGRLFRQALHDDFDYYDTDYLKQTERSNSAWHLSFATLRSDRMVLALWYGTSLVGYVIGALRPGTRESDIFWLYVHPEHRGTGLGRLLVAEAINWLREHHAEIVQLVTYSQVSFYKQQGFEVERLAPGFVGGRDVYIMSKSLI